MLLPSMPFTISSPQGQMAKDSVPAVEIQKVMNVIGQAGIDDISFSALNNDI